jgi:hypothetical protein
MIVIGKACSPNVWSKKIVQCRHVAPLCYCSSEVKLRNLAESKQCNFLVLGALPINIRTMFNKGIMRQWDVGGRCRQTN